ncbi:MFS transporter [Miniimonas arenae]|uniref:MFS transporter n=1 Tax=Miniimonas arenae TaxID=676201 RepID=A0A5C5BDG1_9MICO|nr:MULTISPECIES: MFS transporter [Miniimonas]TNU74059.1 MFS transporter [Miniimonas arenae]
MTQSLAAGEHRSLWRDANFRTFWGGQALSQLGAEVTGLALPVLAVVLLHASELEVGVLNAASVAAFLVVGLPAGAWIDRMRKRRVMIVADAVRAVVLLAIPALWLGGHLTVWHLVAVALVIGVATVFFDVSYQSVIPALVDRDAIPEANGKLESTQQLAALAGPSLGGWLVGAVSAPIAVLTTAATYVASFVALLRTRDHEVVRPAHEREPLRTEIAEGLHWVLGHPLLRRIVGTTAVSNLCSTIVVTLAPILVLRTLGLSPATWGLVFSLGGVGGLAGAALTPRFVRAVGEGRAIPLSAIAFSVVGLAFPLVTLVPTGWVVPVLAAQGMLASAAILVYNVTQVSFRQRITPARLLGRMNASIRFCVWGTMPIAALLAGVLGEWLGVVPTVWLGAVAGVPACLFVVAGPFWRMRALPVAEEDEYAVEDAVNAVDTDHVSRPQA